MSRDVSPPAAITDPRQQIEFAQQILQAEAAALAGLAERLDGSFLQATQLLLDCRGSVLVTGMGKAGLIGQKIAATLASTGTRSHFLHPAEAVHGDLGRVHANDVVLALSKSGETEELVRLLPSLASWRVPIVAITTTSTSTLGRAAQVTLDLGPLDEACWLGLAPSTSTTAMLALGDALALVASRLRGFGRDEFYNFHPAGNLGRRLSRVEDHMRPLAECRVACDSLSVRQVFVELKRPGRRSGAIMLVGDSGRLTGLFTDSDLARLFESRCDTAFDQPIRTVMTPRPCTIEQGSRMSDALELLRQRKISELPVVDSADRPLGLIDITDVVSLLPEEPAGAVKPPKMLQSWKEIRNKK
jgi:arabinose-5-phosphate isomerase